MITYPVSSNFCKKHFSEMLSALRFSIFVISYLFHFKRKMKKKGNTLMEFKYFLFCSSLDLFDVKDCKSNLTDGNLIIKCV